MGKVKIEIAVQPSVSGQGSPRLLASRPYEPHRDRNDAGQNSVVDCLRQITLDHGLIPQSL